MFTELNTRAMQLGIAERFITQLELNLLRIPGADNGYGPVKEALAELSELSDGEQDGDTAGRIAEHLERALDKWQHHLAARDEKIEAYHIRRYCDGLRNPLKQSVFISLLRFYRDIPHSRQSQSKFDLVLTRCFSTQINDLFRAMTMPREQIVEKLSELYSKWDPAKTLNASSSADVAGFDNFIAENDTLLDFPSLTASKLFDRIREFKTSLSDRFWEPAVAAAAVECNIVVGNHLNGLMARESENLGERFGSEFDFAGTLQDTSPNAGERVSEVLREMDEQDPLLSAGAAQEDLGLIRSVIDLSMTADHRPADIEIDIPMFIESSGFLGALRDLASGNASLRSSADRLGIKLEINESIADGRIQFLGPVELEASRLILTLACMRERDLCKPSVLSARTDAIRDILSRAEMIGAELTSEASGGSEAVRMLVLANAMMSELVKTERAFHLGPVTVQPNAEATAHGAAEMVN